MVCFFVLLYVILHFQNQIGAENNKSLKKLGEELDRLNQDIQMVFEEPIGVTAAFVNYESTERSWQNIELMNSQLSRSEKVYSKLLAEYQKKVIDNLYDENTPLIMTRERDVIYTSVQFRLYDENMLLDMAKEAEAMFNKGQYRQAYERYVMVSDIQTENLEARFYRYYSLFLLNKNDRNRYREIRSALLQLDRNGFNHPELFRILKYLDTEEGRAVVED
jgi:hypothetical protein